MKFLSFFAAALVPISAIAAPVALSERDAASLLNSVDQINAGIAGLSSALDAFQGGLLNIGQALDVQSASTKLQNILKDAVKTAKRSEPLDQEGSGTVGIAVLGLQGNIGPLIDKLVAKKPDFDKVGGIFSLRKTVLQALKTDKSLSGQFGDALTSKLTPDFAALAPGIIADINANFDRGIAAYSVRAKGVELPPIPSFG